MQQILDYEISDKIYESTNSLVYRAVHAKTRQSVILKRLREEYPSPQTVARFQREYHLTQSFQDKQIIQVYGLERFQNTWVMILEDFGGESLKSWMNQNKLDLAQNLELGIQMAQILGVVHQHNIIHKDVNPANFVWNPQTGELKLIDFGISTELSQEKVTLTQFNILEGTLPYLSPEQTGRMNRSLDYRTDLYSLGVLLYELLTGHLPFVSEDPLELVHAHIAKAPVPLHERVEGFDQTLSQIVLKLLSKMAEDRYQSAQGLETDLKKCQELLRQKGRIEPFPLGEKDFSRQFMIPDKLYGRESEIQTLLQQFGEAVTSRRLVRIAGYSGIGKTALVHEIHKPVLERRGFFLEGKFDQYQRNVPYSGLLQAFQKFLQGILDGGSHTTEVWRKRFQEALSSNGQVMVEVFPELEKILGKQPPVPELGLMEQHNRFNLVFQDFVRVLATPEHPLALFLDDLQWVDLSSLELLKILLFNERIQGLLLLISYRDNEVDAAHPLTEWFAKLDAHPFDACLISVGHLGRQDVANLLCDTLHVSQVEVTALAEECLKRTDGNPFFLIRFLEFLHQEKILHQKAGTGIWQWNMNAVIQQQMSGNVVELILTQLKKRSPEEQKILALAALLGSRFSLKRLAGLCGLNPLELSKSLLELLKIRILLPVNSEYLQIGEETDHSRVYYRFAHDRLQQAAFSLLDSGELSALHLKAGRLIQQDSLPHQDESLFECVYHLNQGQTLLKSEEDYLELIHLNLKAGQKALQNSAFEPSLNYVQRAITLLPADSWERFHELTVDLYQTAVSAAYLGGKYSLVDSLIEAVFQHRIQLTRKLEFYEIKIGVLTARQDNEQALVTGCEALKLVGIPLSPHPTSIDIVISLLKTKFLMRWHTMESLKEAPLMSDTQMLGAMKILSALTGVAYMSEQNLFLNLSLIGIQLTLRYGIAPESIICLLTYSIVHCGVLLDMKTGQSVSRLAMGLLQKYNLRQLQSKALFLNAHFVSPWFHNLWNSKEPLLMGYKAGLESGDVEYAAYCNCVVAQYFVLHGKNIRQAQEEVRILVEQTRVLNHRTSYLYVLISQATLKNLYEIRKSPLLLDQEQELLEELRAANDHNGVTYVLTTKLHLAFLFEEYEQGWECVQQIPNKDAMKGLAYFGMLSFLDAMNSLQLSELKPQEAARLKKQAVQRQKMIKLWAKHNPMTYQHKWDLIEAERCRLAGHFEDAELFYEKAIQGAQTHEFPLDEALAYEYAGKYFKKRGKFLIATTYLKQAHHVYQILEANAKVHQLEENYEELSALYRISTTTRNYPGHLTIQSTSINTIPIDLDFGSLMKSAQAISGEIHLENLLKKLVWLMMENAGAQKGVLLLQEKQWTIQAMGDNTGRPIEVFQKIPLDSEQATALIPCSIIHHALRISQTVLLDHALVESRFSQDSYVKQHSLKSVLCEPILQHGQLKGVVYLENNLLTGAFTSERLEVLKLLAAQASISIENAQLYANLEQKVQERTQQLHEKTEELAQTNQELAQKNTEMTQDLQTAAVVQSQLFTGYKLPGFLNVAVRYLPHSHVSGDIYKLYADASGGFNLFLGDSTGHGVAAALTTIMADILIGQKADASPQEIMTFINDQLNAHLPDDRFMSAVLLNLRKDGLLTFANAGHPPLMILPANGEEPVLLSSRSLMLGLFSSPLFKSPESTLALHPGDLGILYTDGITEQNNGSDLFGEVRLLQFLKDHRTMELEALLEKLLQEVGQFAEGNPPNDDVSVIVFRYLG
ncbi:MAG: SpoIIE family protein phosphatase [SAR324 cluster bacterium]|nr:SpoIIE family protein phosphatase [SAR324 cluster bacterium]